MAERPKDQDTFSSRQRKFLVIAGIAELLLILPAAILALVVGYHGFKAGEMGTMVGIFSTAVLVFLLPYIIMKGVTIHGLRRGKRWAAVSAIILSALIAISLGFLTDGSPVVIIIAGIYAAVTIWAAVGCLKKSDGSG